MNTIKINIGNGIIIPVDVSHFNCNTPEELHAVIHASYGNDLSHFLEENTDGWEFVWEDDLNDEALSALARAHYARMS